ncbi:hypothetical protein PoB_003979700 [Plakobranchus ocellatus]|uniref:Uncharacterized protein n=1 Tax=Plakobranchus ocellatus TaxID=259542 RepID=A0AAV4B2G6_9GAST|nr:hypothetical protein PoB_003979700 [Plakobranchus ocellatus]
MVGKTNGVRIRIKTKSLHCMQMKCIYAIPSPCVPSTPCLSLYHRHSTTLPLDFHEEDAVLLTDHLMIYVSSGCLEDTVYPFKLLYDGNRKMKLFMGSCSISFKSVALYLESSFAFNSAIVKWATRMSQLIIMLYSTFPRTNNRVAAALWNGVGCDWVPSLSQSVVMI